MHTRMSTCSSFASSLSSSLISASDSVYCLILVARVESSIF
jgi:hypothetical protein